MDINDLRAILTTLGLFCFLAIVWWAYSKGARKAFDDAARLPFAEDDGQGGRENRPARTE